MPAKKFIKKGKKAKGLKKTKSTTTYKKGGIAKLTKSITTGEGLKKRNKAVRSAAASAGAAAANKYEAGGPWLDKVRGWAQPTGSFSSPDLDRFKGPTPNPILQKSDLRKTEPTPPGTFKPKSGKGMYGPPGMLDEFDDKLKPVNVQKGGSITNAKALRNYSRGGARKNR